MVEMLTGMPKVCTVASVSTVIVTAAPAILIVAPKGIDTLAVASFTPKRRAGRG